MLALALVSVGCHATSYRPLDEHRTGYFHTQLQEDLVRVSFWGNVHTSAERASELCLLRAADLTLAAGHTHFLIFDDWVEHSLRAESSISNRATHVVKMLDSAESLETFNADFYERAICQKYGMGADLDEYWQRQRDAEELERRKEQENKRRWRERKRDRNRGKSNFP